MSSQTETHVAVQLRCFLCDHDLPEVDSSPPPVVVALFDNGRINVSKGASKQLRNLLSDVSANYAEYEVSGGRKRFQRYHTTTGLFGYISLSASCGYCRPETSLFMAHWDCWSIAQDSGNISPERLHEFALQTMPCAPGMQEPHVPLLISDLSKVVNVGTTLGKLIVDIMHRLPEELHSRIITEAQLDAMSFQRYGKMSSNQYKALLKASGVLLTRLATVRLSTLPMLKQTFEEAQDVSGKDGGRIHNMYIQTVTLFGRKYISEIGFNGTADDLSTIPVRSDDIRGVRFALGRFGLRGLRVLYADGSVSAWLGNTSSCWYGNVQGRSIRDLKVFANGPQIVRIELSPPRYPDPRVYGALLDSEIDAPSGELMAFITKPDCRKPFVSMPHYPTSSWKFASFLPLVFGSTYTSGLTMFWSRGALRGIAAYGPGNEVANVGSCTGEAVHFPLSPGEYFVSFWIRMGYVKPPSAEPFLLTLGTSLGRSAHFGPQILMRPWLGPAMLRYRWEAISSWAGPTMVTGLLVEALGEWHFGGHRSFGVVQEPLQESTDEEALAKPTIPEIEVLSPDPEDHFDFQETLLSIGSLCDVTKIQIRRKGARCIGMRLTHATGLDDFLGSWDPADESSVSTIHDVFQQGPLVRLLFNVCFKKEDGKPIVVDIIANHPSNSRIASHKVKELKIIPVEGAGLLTDDSLPGDFLVEFLCDRPGKAIAWYHDERMTEARSIVVGDQKPIGRNFDTDGLHALAWEPSVGERRMWLDQWSV